MRQFTREEFLKTTKPYEYLREMKKDPLQYEQALAAIQENTRAVEVRNFRKIYTCYLDELRQLTQTN